VGALEVVLLTLLAGCTGERGPLVTPTDGPGGRIDATSAVVGEWETTLIIQTDTDVQSWITNWLFRRDDTCRYRQTIQSVLDGTTRVKLRDCTWVVRNATLEVTFLDSGEALVLAYSFAAASRDRLVLEGIEYRRIP
jgi:hypothetical protein